MNYREAGPRRNPQLDKNEPIDNIKVVSIYYEKLEGARAHFTVTMEHTNGLLEVQELNLIPGDTFQLSIYPGKADEVVKISA